MAVYRGTIYRSPYGDCTNGGETSQCAPGYGGQDAIVVTDVEHALKARESHLATRSKKQHKPILVVQPGLGRENPTPRLVPLKLIESGQWTMFGGNFVWCREVSELPLPVHDRVETAKESERLSV